MPPFRWAGPRDMAMAILPTAGEALPKSTAGRSSPTRTTASPDPGSAPISWARLRVPSASIAVMDRAPTTTPAAVTIMPPDSATRPAASDVPWTPVTLSVTSEGWRASTRPSMALEPATGPAPSSVVGADEILAWMAPMAAPSSGFPPVVEIIRPAATRTSTKQAVAPPMTQIPALPRGTVPTGGSPVGAPGPAPANSEGCRHRRSSGEIQPRSPSPSALAAQSSSGSGPDAP